MCNDRSSSRLPNPVLMATPRLVSAFVNAAFIIISLPVIVLAYSPPEQKGIQLGLVSAASVVVTVAVLLGVAYASDKLPGTRNRRKPFVIIGHLLVFVAAVVFWLPVSFVSLVAAILVIAAARSAIDSAHLPLLNDLIPENLRGRYSAPISLFQVIGVAGGALLAGYLAQAAENAARPMAFLSPLAGASVLVVFLFGLAFSLSVKEAKRETRARGLRELFSSGLGDKERAYFRFMLARTVYLVGVFIVVIFFVYIVRETYSSSDFKLMSGIYYAVSTVGALAFTIPAGLLADRIGCLKVIYISGAIQAASCVLFFFLGMLHPIFAYVVVLPFGGGFGGIFASSLALSTKLIPREGDTAKFMALLIISTYISQLIGSLLGGPAFDLSNLILPGSGPVTIFALAEFCFLGGGAVFWRIKEPPGFHPVRG